MSSWAVKLKPANKTTSKPMTNYLGWGAKWAIWGTIAVYFAAQIAVAIVAGLGTLILGKNNIEKTLSSNAVVNFSITALSALVMIGLLYVLLKSKKLSLKNLGFKKPIQSDFAWVIVFGVAYMVLSSILLLLVNLIPGFDAEQQQDIGYKSVAGWQMIIAFIGLVVVPPLAEEMVFRGYLYRGLSRGWSNRPVIFGGLFIAVVGGLLTNNYIVSLAITGVIIASIFIATKHTKLAAALFTSAIFGLVHGQWNVAIDVFVLSLMLIALYEKTNNLWACVALHALKNGIAFVALFILK